MTRLSVPLFMVIALMMMEATICSLLGYKYGYDAALTESKKVWNATTRNIISECFNATTIAEGSGSK